MTGLVNKQPVSEASISSDYQRALTVASLSNPVVDYPKDILRPLRKIDGPIRKIALPSQFGSAYYQIQGLVRGRNIRGLKEPHAIFIVPSFPYF